MPEFDWDERKRAINRQKHDLDLLRGMLLFDGRSVVSLPSPRGGEERFITVGETKGASIPWFGPGAQSQSALSPFEEHEMRKNGHIITATAEEIAELPDLSDWEAAARMTEEEIEAAIASDPDERDMVVDWSKAQRGIPGLTAPRAEEPRRTILRTALTSLALVPALLNRLLRPAGKR